MKIAIEAQRIFRKDKHGMDFVILETLKELQKRKDGNEYYVFVAPGEDWCLEESENLHIIELRCPTYPLVGADSIAPGRQEAESGLAALYIEHSSAMVSRPFGADAS